MTGEIRYNHRNRLMDLGARLQSATSDWQGPFFFIQMADCQFGMANRPHGFRQEVAWFGKAMEHCNRLKPAFVAVCGDLIDRPCDEAQTMALFKTAALLDKSIPLHLVCGNHDINDIPNMETLSWYREGFGTDMYAVQDRGCRLIVLNTATIYAPHNVALEVARQDEWLREEMAAARRDRPYHTIVFQHHPWYRYEAMEPDSTNNFPLQQRLMYLDLYVDSGVELVMAGHFHRNLYTHYRGMDMVASGPVGLSKYTDPTGLRIVKVYRNRIEHEYYGLDNVPERVTLEGE
ncbi:MAG: hypothetical protein FJ319_08355 [SAR202 cluster bacterium]|nr:hypothetical protein [SAR202 cluster bacterium]